jgi:uncharacterized repeat protein (TIGR01451 family)
MAMIRQSILLLAMILSSTATAAVKELYWTDDATRDLSRTEATDNTHYGNMGEGATRDLALEAATVRDFTITAGNFTVDFWIRRSVQTGNNREVGFLLTCDICTTTTIASINDQAVGLPVTRTWYKRTVTMNVASDVLVPSGAILTFQVQNDSNGGGNRRIRVRPTNGAATNPSFVGLNITDPIQVDAVTTHTATGCASAATTFEMGDVVYICATVSDPFGAADINVGDTAARRPEASIVNSTTVCTAAFTNVNMSEVGALETSSTKTFEADSTCTILNPGAPAAGPAAGSYTINVTGAFEGTEDAVSDDGSGSFTLIKPAITMTKTSSVVSDPLGQGTFQVPGSIIGYTIVVENNGGGDATDVFVIDPFDTSLTLVADSPAIEDFGTGEGATSDGACDGTTNGITTYTETEGDGSTDNGSDGVVFDDTNDELEFFADGAGLTVEADTCIEVRFRATVD